MDSIGAIIVEHRECGKPKYDGCYEHYGAPHCRADGMAWPCDVDRIAELLYQYFPGSRIVWHFEDGTTGPGEWDPVQGKIVPARQTS